MSQADWNAPQTEEGLRQILRQLEAARFCGDQLEIGRGLLALSHLVKWVRSDTEKSPFERSHELALLSLEAFRLAGDAKGQARALVAASAMADPKQKDNFLTEAETLAQTTGDENDVAMVLAARARGIALSDKAQAEQMHRKALEIYRRSGNEQGQANCLFSLAIGGQTNSEKFDFAIEAAHLNRKLNDPAQASKCMSLALMYSKHSEPLGKLESLALAGLKDALEAANRPSELHFYHELALIAEAKGDTENAKRYRQWISDIEESDGLTPHERWKNNVESAKAFIALAKAQGHNDAAEGFEVELKRLEASEPEP